MKKVTKAQVQQLSNLIASRLPQIEDTEIAPSEWANGEQQIYFGFRSRSRKIFQDMSSVYDQDNDWPEFVGHDYINGIIVPLIEMVFGEYVADNWSLTDDEKYWFSLRYSGGFEKEVFELRETF